LTINIFNKTTISCEESPDPGPEARGGLRQGVPGKEPHHLLHLLDQITGFVARLCSDPLFRDATYKTVKRVAVRRAGKPDLLYPHLRKLLLEPVLHLFHGMSGAKSADYHGSCSFLSIYLCWNVSFCFYLCFGMQLRRFGAKEFFKKVIF
jgi:hypothetical protein